MGSRITYAAQHLSENEVQERMQREQRPWCRRRWEIIAQALKAPRKGEELAKTVGVSVATVHQVMSAYKRGGVAAIETAGKGGRRHQYLTLSQERAFLEPFLARAAAGEMVTPAQIQRAFEEVVNQPVAASTISRLLDRHGWRHLAAGCRPAQAAGGTTAFSPQPREPSPPKGQDASANTVAPPQPSKPSPAKVSRPFSPQGYPSDLTDEEWTILEPLIPPAKPGGHPRTSDIRAVINAILYLDRTGCQWRALPHEYPPWSTVWSYFRRWRNDGTWQQMHIALREQVRVKAGRQSTPSAAIIDSQSVKTTQKGGPAATTVARRSKGASAICSSIPLG
jgi:putative transposase